MNELKEELRKQREVADKEFDNRIHEIKTEKERSEEDRDKIKIKIEEAEDLEHYYNAIKEQEISAIKDRYYLEIQMKEDAEKAVLALEEADAEDDKKSEVPPSGDDTGCDAEPTLGYTDFDSIKKAEEEAEEAKKRREEEEAAANAIKEAEEEAKEELRRLEILQQELEEEEKEEEEEKRKAQILAEQNERDW